MTNFKQPVKLTKCKICRGLFQKRSISHKTCSPPCAIKLTKLDKIKKQRKEDKELKVNLRSKRDWLKLAQQSFNAYIRARDKNKTCICCGQPLAIPTMIGGGFDCGHYRSVGSAPHLRFDERNAHGQTKQCNRWGSGRAVDYRIGLINRIGLAEVEHLESDQSVAKWTIDQLKEIEQTYKRKLKELQQ